MRVGEKTRPRWVQNEGRGREGKTIVQVQINGRRPTPFPLSPAPTPLTVRGLTPQGSNSSELAAKLDKFTFTRVYLYTENHSQGR